jgi:hypothetical protein
LFRWAGRGWESWRTRQVGWRAHDAIWRVTSTVEPRSCSSKDFDPKIG